MESLTSEQRKEFSEIMDIAVPEKGMLAGEIGHGGHPDEKEDMPQSPKAKEEARYKAEMAAFEIAKKARPEEQQAVFLAELSKLDPEAQLELTKSQKAIKPKNHKKSLKNNKIGG